MKVVECILEVSEISFSSLSLIYMLQRKYSDGLSYLKMIYEIRIL